MEDRKEKRTFGLKNVIIKDLHRTFQAVLTDISTTGLCIKTDQILPTFKEVIIIIQLEDEPCTLRGSVRWVNEHPEKPVAILNEIGIALIDAPINYIEYIENISS